METNSSLTERVSALEVEVRLVSARVAVLSEEIARTCSIIAERSRAHSLERFAIAMERALRR